MAKFKKPAAKKKKIRGKKSALEELAEQVPESDSTSDRGSRSQSVKIQAEEKKAAEMKEQRFHSASLTFIEMMLGKKIMQKPQRKLPKNPRFCLKKILKIRKIKNCSAVFQDYPK